MRLINRFLIFFLAPFIGLGIMLFSFVHNTQAYLLPITDLKDSVSNMEKVFYSIEESSEIIAGVVAMQEGQFRNQQIILDNLMGQVEANKKYSDDIYEERILTMLGPPVREHYSEKLEIKVFKLSELGYRGYIAKVKLFDPSLFKVVLGKDTLGEKETTLQAANRTGAILAINGGGFYTEMRDGKPYGIHMGNTVINGKIIGRFNPYPYNICFAGINRQGKLVGGIYYEEEQFWQMDPWQGVSFLPILIKGGMVHPVPEDWAKTKQPRTIIGEYANGDLILIVVDGRSYNWSAGVTLERLQEKLVELGVKEAYNLDGGGSSTFVFDGKILNKPSDGKSRPVVSNIVILPK